MLLSSGSFEGRPMPKHVAIPGIEAAEFAHWLALFRKTLERLARDPAAVELVHARARMIARYGWDARLAPLGDLLGLDA